MREVQLGVTMNLYGKCPELMNGAFCMFGTVGFTMNTHLAILNVIQRQVTFISASVKFVSDLIIFVLLSVL